MGVILGPEKTRACTPGINFEYKIPTIIYVEKMPGCNYISKFILVFEFWEVCKVFEVTKCFILILSLMRITYAF